MPIPSTYLYTNWLFRSLDASHHPYIAAFEAASGDLLWDDEPWVEGLFRSIGVKHQRVVAVGSAGAGLLVRAYDVGSGTLAWEDQPAVPPGYREFAIAIALNDTAVYICGSSGKDFEDFEMLVRAYDSADGRLQCQINGKAIESGM